MDYHIELKWGEYEVFASLTKFNECAFFRWSN